MLPGRSRKTDIRETNRRHTLTVALPVCKKIRRKPGRPRGGGRTFLKKSSSRPPPASYFLKASSTSRVDFSMYWKSSSLSQCWNGKEIWLSKKASALGQSAVPKPSFL